MSTTSDHMPGSSVGTEPPRGGGAEPTGFGWLLFAGIMLVLVAVLNMTFGIAAISGSSFFVDDAHYIVSGLNGLGWVTLGLAVGQVFAAFSIWRGGSFGR
jgi:uncharacterized membrane protein